MGFWKGALTPNLVKTISSTEYKPLEEMTEDDWAWLDYEDLRSVAQNRIAEIAADDEDGLDGFLIVRTSGGKGVYYWPVPIDTDINDIPITNAPDDFQESDTAREIRLNIQRIKAFSDSRFHLLLIISLIKSFVINNPRVQNKDYADDYVNWSIDNSAVAMIMSLMLYLRLARIASLLDELIDVTNDSEGRAWVVRWGDNDNQIAAGRGLT